MRAPLEGLFGVLAANYLGPVIPVACTSNHCDRRSASI